MPFTDLSPTHCIAITTAFLQKRSNIANWTCLQLFTHFMNHHKLQINIPVYFKIACFIEICYGNWFSANWVRWFAVWSSSEKTVFGLPVELGWGSWNSFTCWQRTIWCFAPELPVRIETTQIGRRTKSSTKKHNQNWFWLQWLNIAHDLWKHYPNITTTFHWRSRCGLLSK